MMRRMIERLFAVLLVATCIQGATAQAQQVIYETRSEFNGRVEVQQDSFGLRTLVFDDGATQSSWDTTAPDRLVLPYARAAMTALAFVPEPKRILIVGLGGGSMPRFLRKTYPEAVIDVVELDPVVADIARRFFDFKEDAKMTAHIADGRKFIETTDHRYDIIFLDAYGSDDIPYALATREFLAAVRSKLTDKGIAVSNIWSELHNRLFWSMVKTYLDTFDEVHIIRAPQGSGNRIVVALPRKANLDRQTVAERAEQVQQQRTPNLDLAGMVRGGYVRDIVPPRRARVLRDDRR